LYIAGKGQQIFLVVYIHRRTLRTILDSRATSNFINIKIAQEQGFGIVVKQQLYRLSIIDKKTIGSNKGIITYKTDWLEMKTWKGHTEKIQFDLVTIRTHAVILGIPWLRTYNPQID
jgi:hypothetical protein